MALDPKVAAALAEAQLEAVAELREQLKSTNRATRGVAASTLLKFKAS